MASGVGVRGHNWNALLARLLGEMEILEPDTVWQVLCTLGLGGDSLKDLVPTDQSLLKASELLHLRSRHPSGSQF